MSATLAVNNFGNTNKLEEAQLNADATLGANQIVVVGTQNITANRYLVLGNPNENAEIVQVLSVAGTTVTIVGTLSYTHLRYERVTVLFGNQIKVYRAPATSDGKQPADNLFALTTGGTIAIDPDQLQTVFTDSDGSSDYWYKGTFYNSTSTLESNLGDSTAARGNGYGLYTSVQAIKDEAGLGRNKNISDAQVDGYRKQAQALINAKLAARYVVPFKSPVNEYIRGLTERLASGYMLIKQYGSYTVSDTNNGQARIDQVMDELKELQAGTMTLIGEEAVGGGDGGTSTGTGGFDGWPNAATETTDGSQGGAERQFRMSSVQGYTGRKY